MKNKWLLVLLFVIMACIQWIVPMQMVRDSRSTLVSGTEYKFRLAPVDPEDPFRGKYLDLDFDISRVKVGTPPHWTSGDKVFVVLETDSAGFARVNRLSREIPEPDTDFIASRIRSAVGEDSLLVFIEYPLDRYYINEKIAGPIEEMIFENQRDSTKINYALVRVRAGKAILEELYIDEIPVSEWTGHK